MTIPRMRRIALALGIAVVAVAVVWTLAGSLRRGTASTNMYALQAQSFLRGRLALDRPVEDVAVFNGNIYSPYPPGPAIVLVPVVAVFGMQGPTPVVVAIVAAVLIAWLAMRIGDDAGLPLRSRSLLTAGLLLGTGLWSAVLESGSVWFLAHVIAVMFLLASLDAALRGRALLAGVFLGSAFLSRQLTILALPFVVAIVLDRRDTAEHRRAIATVCAPVAACVALYLALNAARFSGPFDTGYSYIALSDFLKERVDAYGLFSPAYIPFNFVHMFFQGPHVEFTGPKLLDVGGMDPFGTSLTFASPFLLFAFAGRPRRRLAIPAWVSVGVILLGELTYYNNGFAQTNAQRFALDFVPLLFVLLAWAMARRRSPLVDAAIVFAIGLNVVALFLIPR